MKNLVEKAREGSRSALEELILSVQGKVYELSLRMLGHPEDAEDAAQEILIKVITNIGGFRGESAFSTWVYRIAANHLLSARKKRMERMGFSFEVFEEGIERIGPVPEPGNDPEERLLMDELRSNCMQAILVCLDRKHRMAFILGDIFGVTSREGADILDIEPAAFRKRASRAREKVREFMTRNCGLVNPSAGCHCTRQVKSDIRRGWIDPGSFLYAGKTGEKGAVLEMEGLDEMARMAILFRTYPVLRTPESFSDLARELVAGRDNG
jgi:RNA polymerase sigma factor (sigma-70 family)